MLMEWSVTGLNVKGQSNFMNPSSIVCLIASGYQALASRAKESFSVQLLIRMHPSVRVVHGLRLRRTNFGLPNIATNALDSSK